MATATVHANGRVNLNVPNVSILVDRREAEALRDALNQVLPERIEDLVLDPRIKDLHVLQAAQAIATEHECPRVAQLLAHMVTLYYADGAPARRCALCRCDATGELHGFAVCDYHLEHGEDDPPCPACNADDAAQLEDGRQLVAELRGMTRVERETRVAVGDRVRDPMDGGKWRRVTRIEGTTVYMADGGCMGIDECREIRLPSEALDRC